MDSCFKGLRRGLGGAGERANVRRGIEGGEKVKGDAFMQDQSEKQKMRSGAVRVCANYQSRGSENEMCGWEKDIVWGRQGPTRIRTKNFEGRISRTDPSFELGR